MPALLLIISHFLMCRSLSVDGGPRVSLTLVVPDLSTTLGRVARALHQSERVSNLTATVFLSVSISLDTCREVSMDLLLSELARVRLAMAVVLL